MSINLVRVEECSIVWRILIEAIEFSSNIKFLRLIRRIIGWYIIVQILMKYSEMKFLASIDSLIKVSKWSRYMLQNLEIHIYHAINYRTHKVSVIDIKIVSKTPRY